MTDTILRWSIVLGVLFSGLVQMEPPRTKLDIATNGNRCSRSVREQWAAQERSDLKSSRFCEHFESELVYINEHFEVRIVEHWDVRPLPQYPCYRIGRHGDWRAFKKGACTTGTFLTAMGEICHDWRAPHEDKLRMLHWRKCNHCYCEYAEGQHFPIFCDEAPPAGEDCDLAWCTEEIR